jgi:hypothetical protein
MIEAYGRACAMTGEHSLPALDAAHIRSWEFRQADWLLILGAGGYTSDAADTLSS